MRDAYLARNWFGLLGVPALAAILLFCALWVAFGRFDPSSASPPPVPGARPVVWPSGTIPVPGPSVGPSSQ